MAKPWHNYPPGFKAQIYERDNYHCRIGFDGICKHSLTCTGCAENIDHIVPPRFGGMYHTFDNCRAACAPCNQARNRKGYTPPPPTTRYPEHW